jgi:cell division protease FtsH
VILICATNRPDELDESFVRPGRIDREIHIGLPGEKERIAIFGVHSAGKRLAKDVDFRKLVFRTIGYSGADIRNIINEAGIMAVS